MLYDKDFDLINSLNNGMGFLKPPSQGVWGFGGEKPDFSRSENVALCL